MFPIEIHAVRLGDVAIVTNPIEPYLDYGIRMKGRSPAVQTFVVELAGSASYLPTERAVRRGGYGAIAKTSVVGPQGRRADRFGDVAAACNAVENSIGGLHRTRSDYPFHNGWVVKEFPLSLSQLSHV